MLPPVDTRIHHPQSHRREGRAHHISLYVFQDRSLLQWLTTNRSLHTVSHPVDQGTTLRIYAPRVGF